ncbi:MAG: SusC/RagA family TonB-linked outer membrane protein [Gemmatimonadaceae bacterium]
MEKPVVRQRWTVGLAALVAAALPIVALRATAQNPNTGTIEGRVTERATGRPVPGATVMLVGTTRGTVVGEAGQFRLPDVAPGQYQLRALRIGYEAVTQPVTVSASGRATIDFTLSAAAVRLDEVVTTATGEQQRRRENGNAVDVVQVSPEQLAVKSTVTDVLTAASPGVNVTVSGGTTGGGSRIRIRGANSVSLSNEPLVIVDGVRLNIAVTNDNTSGSTSLGVGGQVPSRINDVDQEDIESIEVLKGPAASALYGTAAANGVIQIRTKRGRPGKTKWQGYAEAGSVRNITAFPANYAQIGTRIPSGTRTTACTLDFQARGLCTAIPDSLVNFNPLVQASPFIHGYLTNYGLSASGGSDISSFYLAGDFQNEQGVVESSTNRRVNVRANLNTRLLESVGLRVNTGYTQGRLRLPQNDNNILGIVSSGLLGSAFDNPTSRGYLSGQTPQALYAIDTRQNVERFISSANLDWQPLSWLSGVGTAGLDYLDRYDFETIPPNRVNFGSLPDGQRSSNPYRIYNYTTNGGLTATTNLSPDLNSKTSIGVQFNKELISGTRAFGAKLLGGTGSLSGASARFSVGETNTDNKTLGGYIQQQLAWRDRLFVTGALRTDNNSAFGQNFGFIKYPAASISWVVSDEPYFPKIDVLSSLRLRTAYGESGQRPNFRDAITFFNAQTVNVGGSDVPGIVVGGTGDPGLRPERSVEHEAGLEAGFFNQRLGFEVTYYYKKTRDLLIAFPLPPSLGVTATEFKNLGSARNLGWEYLATAKLVDSDPYKLDLRISASTNENRLLSLGFLPNGQPVAPIVFGVQQHRVGYPLGGYWQQPILGYQDNGNHVVSRVNCPGQTQIAGGPPCGIQLGDTNVFLGGSLPTRLWAFEPNLQLFSWFRVRALIDHKGGYKQFNFTGRFRCSFRNCREASDKNTPLVAQAANIAQLLNSDAGYVEDGTFTKLREVAVTLVAPSSLAASLRAAGASLTVAGRNLKTWTDYTGFDPEVNSSPGSSFSTSDFLTQPPNRYVTVRLNLTY